FDAGFSSTGFTADGYQFSHEWGIHYAAAGTGTSVATWTATVTPGQYRVAATWNSMPNHATNAPFTVLDGTTNLGTVIVDQKLVPTDFADMAVTWKDLGVFTITGN